MIAMKERLQSRIRSIEEENEREKKEIAASMEAYVRRAAEVQRARAVEKEAEQEAEQAKEADAGEGGGKADHAQASLVESEYIRPFLGAAPPRQRALGVDEEKGAKMFLNKKLAQLSNKREKVERTAADILAGIKSTCATSEKAEQYAGILIERINEQARAQVSANPQSAYGFALLFFLVSNGLAQTHGVGLADTFRHAVFSSIGPFQDILAMYRIYFTILSVSESKEEAWKFISSLLNHVEGLGDTINPLVANVFLEVLGPQMGRWFRDEWPQVLEYVEAKYVPLLDARFSSEITRLVSLARQPR